MSDSKVTRKIFGFKKYGVVEQFKMLHNEELCTFHGSPCIDRTVKCRSLRWAEHVVRMRRRGIHTEFQWKNIEKPPLARPLTGWENNIKTDVKKKRFLRMGDGWHLLRIVSNGSLLVVAALNLHVLYPEC
jgi:hypothetical protein